MSSQTPLCSTLTWHGLDALSGVRAYDLEVSPNGGMSWTPLVSAAPLTQTEFIGTPGQSYHFRLRAIDNVSNESGWLVVGPMAISSVTKYYLHGGQRVAMRRGDEVYYLHGDHLGSTSLTTDSSGAVVSEVRYLPYGEERWASGEAQTDFGFTSQRKEGFGLYDYNARYYSPRLGRFISPDTIVPEPANPQAWNRYAYVMNNPLRHTDSTGHCIDEEEGKCDLETEKKVRTHQGRLRRLSNMVWNEQSSQAGANDIEKQEIWVLTSHTALNREAMNGDARTVPSLENVLAKPGQFLGYEGPVIPGGAQNNPEKWNALTSVVDGTLTGDIPDPSGGITNFGNISFGNQPGTDIPAIDAYESALQEAANVGPPPEGVTLSEHLSNTIGYDKIEGNINWFVYNTSGHSVPIQWIGNQPYVRR